MDKSKELDASKNITSTNWDKAFPQPGEVLEGAKNKANWGFLSKATDLDKVCKVGEEDSCKKEDKWQFFKGL